MDKNKLFQKQLLQSKIDENVKSLSTLQNLYDDLKIQSKENISLLMIALKNTALTTISKLLEEKEHLEQTKKKIKQTINNFTLDISTLEKDLLQLPDKTKEKLNHEITIYNDEIERIDNEKSEVETIQIESINKAMLDKVELEKEIELLKNNVYTQANIISTIQINCHSSRKDIIENLKQKKQMKLELKQNSENCITTVTHITDKINELNTTIENLIDFKKLLVDAEYEYEYETITMKLHEYYSLFNIDSNLSLNEKINQIDLFIDNHKNQIILFTKKLNRTEELNKLQLNNNTIIYNNTHKNKVMTYKDCFKMEKEKKKEIETILEYKLYYKNNYEILVIDKINNNCKLKIEHLELDKKKANDRLNIVKIRMNREFEANKKMLKNQIEQVKLNINKLGEDMSNISNNSKILLTTIEKEKKINEEMFLLETKIKTHQDSIIQFETDLLTLE